MLRVKITEGRQLSCDRLFALTTRKSFLVSNLVLAKEDPARIASYYNGCKQWWLSCETLSQHLEPKTK